MTEAQIGGSPTGVLDTTVCETVACQTNPHRCESSGPADRSEYMLQHHRAGALAYADTVP